MCRFHPNTSIRGNYASWGSTQNIIHCNLYPKHPNFDYSASDDLLRLLFDTFILNHDTKGKFNPSTIGKGCFSSAIPYDRESEGVH